MTEEEILQIFKNTGALLDGHFILTSGMHSPHYIEKFRVLEHPRYTEILCRELAEKFRDDNITLVVGPMTGGILLAYEVGKNLDTRAIFTERVDGKMKFRRGFDVKPDDRVLIVEDIISTGGSVQEVIDEVKRFKAEIVGIGCLVDRSGGKVDFGIPLKPLVKMDVIAFKPDEIPEWLKKIPVTKPGSTNK
ncbi:MAG: orotate phosphoribosyltransferase [Ignavibacteria bacterium]|nr:orotate phosphoribosyltransferase [Ignavibacteria bacterium]